MGRGGSRSTRRTPPEPAGRQAGGLAQPVLRPSATTLEPPEVRSAEGVHRCQIPQHLRCMMRRAVRADQPRIFATPLTNQVAGAARGQAQRRAASSDGQDRRKACVLHDSMRAAPLAWTLAIKAWWRTSRTMPQHEPSVLLRADDGTAMFHKGYRKVLVGRMILRTGKDGRIAVLTATHLPELSSR